jgi:hypothetical protein
MRTAARWALSFLIGLVFLVGLIALINSRDQSGVDQHASVTAGPGKPYHGEPVLSPGLQDLVKRGNVILLYRDANPPAGTRQLVPPGGDSLARAGQAVVLEREPTLETALAAVSSKKIEAADSPQQLTGFIDYWLGGR